MGVKTTVFGSVRLSGEDAKKFQRQVKYGRPKKAAIDAYATGKHISSKMDEQGFVEFTAKSQAV